MDYIFLIIISLLLSWLIYKDIFRSGLSKSTLLTLWGIKLSFSIVFILINIHYFGNGHLYGDIANFFNDGLELNKYAAKDPGGYCSLLLGFNTDNLDILQTHLSETNIWSYGDNGDFINDNRLIIRVNSLIYFFSTKSIAIHIVIFAFLSFAGSILIYKSVAEYIIAKKAFLFGLFLFPSIGFWGSAPAKETLSILGIGLFFYCLSKLKSKHNWKFYLIIVISVALLLLNKPHIGLIIIPLSVIVVIGYHWGFSRKIGFMIVSGILLAIITFSLTPSRVNIIDRISYKQRDLINVAQGGIFFITDSSFCSFDYDYLENFTYNAEEGLITVDQSTAGEYKLFGKSEFHPFEMSPSDEKYEVYHIINPSKSYVDVTPINLSAKQLIANIPSAIVNVMIRPYPNDPGDPLKILIFLENTFFICWWVFVLFRRKKLDEIETAWLFYLLSASILLVLIIGLTTPILGAVVRYKMIVLLLLYISSFIIFNGKLKRS